MNRRTTVRSKVLALVSTVALTLSGLAVGVLTAPTAAADISRVLPPPSNMVTADALPTVQINGVVWSQAVAGNTVYAGGKFSTARPAGSAPGSNTTPRNNLLAYDITTGNLVTSFTPDMNAQVLAVSVSPDGSRVYVGGDFTTANGVTHNRIAAYSTATGKLIAAFSPTLTNRVNTIFATNSTVYVGGAFGSANGTGRDGLAAFNASNGALLAWNPAPDSEVTAMTLTPDGSRLIVGGRFTKIGGSDNYGLAAVNASTGVSLPWAANALIRNAGPNASITSLRTDGSKIYGTGYVYGAGGNLEGTFAADPTTGAISWVEDCHGDSYDNLPINGTVYTVSHAHYCSTVGGFFQSDPWEVNMRHAVAFTANATGTLGHNEYGGYYDFFGNPAPSMINWFPTLAIGSYTGQYQSAWSLAGTSQYVAMGGEFPSVNETAQQGLVRFAVKPIAPSKQGPTQVGSNFVSNAVSLSSGTVRVAFPANWDRDNKTLNYRVVRNNNTAQPVYQVTADSTFWERPTLGFVDTGLAPGSTVTYRLYANDSPDPNNPAAGNTAVGNTVTVTVANTGALSNYAQLVNTQGASTYWRLGESSGTAVYDWSGFNDGTAGTGVTRGAPGMDSGDTNTASTFNGTANGVVTSGTSSTAPDTFSTVAWIKTTSQSGGKIIGFGNADRLFQQLRPAHLHGQQRAHLVRRLPRSRADCKYDQVLQRRQLASGGQLPRTGRHGAVRGRPEGGFPHRHHDRSGLRRLLASGRRQSRRLDQQAVQRLPQRHHRRGLDLPDRPDQGPGARPVDRQWSNLTGAARSGGRLRRSRATTINRICSGGWPRPVARSQRTAVRH